MIAGARRRFGSSKPLPIAKPRMTGSRLVGLEDFNHLEIRPWRSSPSGKAVAVQWRRTVPQHRVWIDPTTKRSWPLARAAGLHPIYGLSGLPVGHRKDVDDDQA